MLNIKLGQSRNSSSLQYNTVDQKFPKISIIDDVESHGQFQYTS